MENKDLNLSAPWEVLVKKMQALFEPDPRVHTEWNEAEKVLTLRVDGQKKADALTRLLPPEYTFGGVTMNVRVVPSNVEPDYGDVIEDAMSGNPLFSEMVRIQPAGSSNTFRYAMFQPQLVQFWTDTLADPHGIQSMTVEQLARELLGEEDGVMFSTEQM